MRLIINEAAKLVSFYRADAALLARTYGTLVGKVNGITGSEKGPVPGFFVEASAANYEVKTATAPAKAIGLIASYPYPLADGDYPSRSNSDYTFKESGVPQLTIVGRTAASLEVQAYAVRNDADGSDLSYSVGDVLYISTVWGCLTKDATSNGTAVGVVTAALPEGGASLGVELF